MTCIYDNGAKSPNIQGHDCKPVKQDRVDFDPKRPVCKIKFAVYTQYKMPAIGFYDRDDELIDSYDPEGYGL